VTRPPPIAIYRSIYRGRLLYATPGRVLAETPRQVVTATLPGDETIQLAGPRRDVIPGIAAGRERTHRTPWERTRVVWITCWDGAHSIGLFWTAESGRFDGYYVNLQAPLRRSPVGFDSMDHVLDIVVSPDGRWQWKDEDELDDAVQVGMFSAPEAAEIRKEGERVIARLPELLPTGWEDWQPDPGWPALTLPSSVELTLRGLKGCFPPGP
jgi:hypothetical protein